MGFGVAPTPEVNFSTKEVKLSRLIICCTSSLEDEEVSDDYFKKEGIGVKRKNGFLVLFNFGARFFSYCKKRVPLGSSCRLRPGTLFKLNGKKYIVKKID